MDLVFLEISKKLDNNIVITETVTNITKNLINDLKEPINDLEEPINDLKEQEINNKKKSTLYVRKFIENNKDKIHTKIECPVCMSSYTYFNKSKHNKTKRHIKFLEKQQNNLPLN